LIEPTWNMKSEYLVVLLGVVVNFTSGSFRILVMRLLSPL